MRGASRQPANAPVSVLLINGLGVGGAERAVQTAVSELGRRRWDVRLVCLESTPQTSVVPVHALSRMSSSAGGLRKLAALPFLSLRLSRYVRASRAQVVMSHLFRANFVNVLARIIARSPHGAVVVNHTRVSRLRTEGLQGRVNWLLCRWLYPKADVVASVSVGAAAETARLLALKDGHSVVLHDPIAAVAASATAASVPALVCVGRLVALKRFQDVITAFSRIASRNPGLQLRIVGDGPERIRLEDAASRLGVAGRVVFHGAVDDPGRLVSGCACFVSSSETEGFGMAIVEALSAGVPVVASDCPYGPREILSPDSDPAATLGSNDAVEVARYGVLYPVGSVEALEEALLRVLGDDGLRAELSRRGPGRAADFSVARSVAEYERLLFPGRSL